MKLKDYKSKNVLIKCNSNCKESILSNILVEDCAMLWNWTIRKVSLISVESKTRLNFAVVGKELNINERKQKSCENVCAVKLRN